MGLAGIGDLTLTCTGTQSRNTSFGIELGKGRSVADVLAERHAVTEGVVSAESVTELGRRLDLELPLPAAVDRIVNHGADIDETIESLEDYPMGLELPGID